MKPKLVAIIATNHFGNYIGVVGAVIRSRTGGSPFVIPAAFCVPSFDLSFARHLVLRAVERVARETKSEFQYYAEPLASRTFTTENIPVFMMDEIERQQMVHNNI